MVAKNPPSRTALSRVKRRRWEVAGEASDMRRLYLLTKTGGTDGCRSRLFIAGIPYRSASVLMSTARTIRRKRYLPLFSSNCWQAIRVSQLKVSCLVIQLVFFAPASVFERTADT